MHRNQNQEDPGQIFPKMGNYLRMKKNSLLYLGIGFFLALLLLTIFVVLSNQRLNALITYSDQVEHTYQVIEHIEILNTQANDAETAVRGFILTRDSSYLDPYFNSRKNIPVTLEKLKGFTSDNEMQQVRLGMLRNTLLLRLKILEDALVMIDAGTYDQEMPQRMGKGKELMDTFRNELNTIRKEEQSLLAGRFVQKEAYQKLAPNIIRQLSFLVGIVSVVLFIFLMIELLRRLKFQKALQQQVLALKQSNDELTQLAFAASHDLQEPVRKMRIYTDRLVLRLKGSLPAEDLMMLGRIDVSGRRLQSMLEDISNYLDLIGSDEQKVQEDLNIILEDVIRKNEPAIVESNTKIHINNLPALPVYPKQVNLLFQCLLDNAIKFAKPGVPPEIKVYCERISGEKLRKLVHTPIHSDFWIIYFRDNGIGFDNAYRDKIFQLFRRLHTSDEFSGKGIGLAICQRILSNHQGFIDGMGIIGEGASFLLYFPVE